LKRSGYAKKVEWKGLFASPFSGLASFLYSRPVSNSGGTDLRVSFDVRVADARRLASPRLRGGIHGCPVV
jgi:hypothetical protein